MENNIKYLEEQKKVFQVITREFVFFTHWSFRNSTAVKQS